ncbi:hypothetical protein [Akkermansia muciniphila]|uniref:hypothetical protein n=1 Tax=Akkermansia muciniphila TaxID=239935 RepID=UPI001BFF4CE0|nr:hypothetical protein [Akkermansia muciniphila]MBT8778854.1 hypothetical protein [Akkermansia muciniphila]
MNIIKKNILIIALIIISLSEFIIILNYTKFSVCNSNTSALSYKLDSSLNDDDFVPDISSEYPHIYFKNLETEEGISIESGVLITERKKSRQSIKNKDYFESETIIFNPNGNNHLPTEIKNTPIFSIPWTPDLLSTESKDGSLYMEIQKRSSYPLKMKLNLRAKDSNGQEWNLIWVPNKL